MELANSERIDDILTKEGLAKLKVGQILRFDYEGSINEMQITKINRKGHKCWAKRVRTYHPDEIQTVDAFGDKEAFNIEELKDGSDRTK
jgi:hypothetical protein